MKASLWHQTDIKAYQELRDRIELEFPELQFSEREGKVILSGIYPITDEAGRVLDRFQIEVVIPPGGPRTGIPVVYETGGRIPQTSDRHIETDGKACLFVPDEFWYLNPDGMDLVDFLSGPVKSFFIGQSLAESGMPWPQGERSHGIEGIFEFYSEVLDTKSLVQILDSLKILSKPAIKGHWSCPCGSGEILRNCHLSQLVELRDRIPEAVAKESIARIEKVLTQ